MTAVETHRAMRNRLLVAVALSVYLAVLAVWQFETIRGGAAEPMNLLVLGVIVGAVTGAGIVARQR